MRLGSVRSPTSTYATYTFNFTPLAPTDATTSATFKFFGWNTNDTNGTMRLDDVSAKGTIGVIPEPSTFVTSGIVLLLLAARTGGGSFGEERRGDAYLVRWILKSILTYS
jgi:hypothetical protein